MVGIQSHLPQVEALPLKLPPNHHDQRKQLGPKNEIDKYKQTCIETDTYAYLHNLWLKSDATISSVLLLLGIAPRGSTKNANRRHPKKIVKQLKCNKPRGQLSKSLGGFPFRFSVSTGK